MGFVAANLQDCVASRRCDTIFSGRVWNHLPPLPASVELDAADIIVKVGSEVTDVAVGDRVYANPRLSCGNTWSGQVEYLERAKARACNGRRARHGPQFSAARPRP